MVSTHLKNISQIGNHPQIGGENKKSLKPPPKWYTGPTSYTSWSIKLANNHHENSRCRHFLSGVRFGIVSKTKTCQQNHLLCGFTIHVLTHMFWVHPPVILCKYLLDCLLEMKNYYVFKTTICYYIIVILPTQTVHYYKGKSFKTPKNLSSLILPKWLPLNDSCESGLE